MGLGEKMITFIHKKDKLEIIHDKIPFVNIDHSDYDLLEDIKGIIIDVYCLGLRDRVVTFDDIEELKSK